MSSRTTSGTNNPPNALIVGASFAGLASALSLRGAGWKVRLVERERNRQRNGGGLVLTPDLDHYVKKHCGISNGIPAVWDTMQLTYAADGTIETHERAVRLYTAWDAFLRTFETAFGRDHIENGVSIRHVTCRREGCAATLTSGEEVRTDLLIGADGIGSRVRTLCFPEVPRQFAGYVAWRGLAPVSALNALDSTRLGKHFASYQYDGAAEFLSYPVPGSHGKSDFASRRVNWVWYTNIREDQLTALLTDANGHLHHASLGRKEVPGWRVAEIRTAARNVLPAPLASLVEVTRRPFLQAIFDLRVPTPVNGRCVLTGDAGGPVRPHTASGMTKAVHDGVALGLTLARCRATCSREEPFGKMLTARLSQWAQGRQAEADAAIKTGKELAALRGLGHNR